MKTEWVGGDAVDWIAYESRIGDLDRKTDKQTKTKEEREKLKDEIFEMTKSGNFDLGLDYLIDLHLRIENARDTVIASIERFHADTRREKIHNDLVWLHSAEKAKSFYTSGSEKCLTRINYWRKRQAHLEDIARQQEMAKLKEARLLQHLTQANPPGTRQKRRETEANVYGIVIKLIRQRELISNKTMSDLLNEAREIIQQQIVSSDAQSPEHDKASEISKPDQSPT